jgi:hypothetical protein
MADVKISALPASTTPLAGTEVLPIVQSSTTRQVSVANLTAGRAVSALSITASSLTSGRVTYAGTAGLLQDSANLTFDGSNLGLGLTPSAGSFKKIEIGYAGTSFSSVGQASSLIVTNGYFNSGWKYGGTGEATYYYQDAGTHKWYNAPSGTAGNAITFTQAMTLDASGNLLVGTTTGTGSQLRVHTAGTQCSFMQNSAAAPNGLQIYYSNATAPNNTASEFLYFSDTSALRMSVRSNGGIANYTANNVVLSDKREKTNFAPSKSYLDVICAIPVQTFNYIDQNLETDAGLTLGVTAQDVQAVAPELVTEGNWGTKENPKMRLEIYQTDLQYALMKALQELKAEFDAYKATHP